MEYSIRKLESQDYYKGYIELLENLTAVQENGKIKYDQFLNTIKTMPHVYVIENDGIIIASGTLIVEQKIIHNLNKVGHIEDIVISKDHRKKGLGKLIVSFLTELARKNMCYKVILNCEKDVIPFYSKMGYRCKNVEMSRYF